MRHLARGALAGTAGATVWTISEPLLRRALGTPYSDVQLAGRLLTRGRLWPVAGVVAHTALGAGLGSALAAAGLTTPYRAVLGSQAENLATWPGMALAGPLPPGPAQRRLAAPADEPSRVCPERGREGAVRRQGSHGFSACSRSAAGPGNGAPSPRRLIAKAVERMLDRRNVAPAPHCVACREPDREGRLRDRRGAGIEMRISRDAAHASERIQ